jgi:hypothetical protein
MVTKEDIEWACESHGMSFTQREILKDAYLEAIEALREIVTARTQDGRKIAIQSAKVILEKAPEEKKS